METLTSKRFAIELRGTMAAPLARLLALCADLRGRAHDAAARRECAQLDARTLRDIGLDRSEFDSCLAESRRAAERTRRRIAHVAR